MIIIADRIPRLGVEYLQATQTLRALKSAANGKPDMFLIDSLILNWAEGIELLKKEMINQKGLSMIPKYRL